MNDAPFQGILNLILVIDYFPGLVGGGGGGGISIRGEISVRGYIILFPSS